MVRALIALSTLPTVTVTVVEMATIAMVVVVGGGVMP
jgi:hypothetical protein